MGFLIDSTNSLVICNFNHPFRLKGELDPRLVGYNAAIECYSISESHALQYASFVRYVSAKGDFAELNMHHLYIRMS
jgi:hypothetical protein